MPAPSIASARTAIAVTLAMAALLGPALAHAQDSDLSARLAADIPCSSPAAGQALRNRLDAVDADAADLLAALDRLGSDAAVCDPLRQAASRLAGDMAAARAARERMERALRDADSRAASLQFGVGPPPPNMTRRKAGVP